MKKAALFILLAVVAGYGLQEESGICLPEIHADIPCHCLDMGGYQLCGKNGEPYSYNQWAEENQRREADKDKKGKQKQPDIPMCKMSCKEDHCECCKYDQRFHRKAAITIPYDPI